MNLVPVSGILLSALLLGERLGPTHLCGAALVLAGVLWLQRPGRA